MSSAAWKVYTNQAKGAVTKLLFVNTGVEIQTVKEESDPKAPSLAWPCPFRL